MLTYEVDKRQARVKFGKNKSDRNKILKRALLRAVSHGRDIIEEHMDTSTSYKGGSFKPYSKEYKEYRKDKGRGTKPDLQFTKQMRSAMQVRSNSKQGEIYFSRKEEAQKAAKNNKTRPFFGFNKRELAKIKKVFERNLK
jgi:ATPase subunit of ABC transporter with duplicated ATPase domains